MAGHYVAPQPVERVADRNQLEHPGRGREILRGCDYRPHAREPGGLSFRAHQRDHLWLKVHRPHVAEPAPEGEPELPGATSQVKQRSQTIARAGTGQIVDKGLRIREPELVVCPRRAPEQVGAESRIAHASIVRPAQSAAWTEMRRHIGLDILARSHTDDHTAPSVHTTPVDVTRHGGLNSFIARPRQQC